MNKLAQAFTLAATLMSVPAGAAEPVATLLDAQGKVLINKGEGFAAATSGVALNATDKLVVGTESQAVVSYPVCTVTLAKSSMFAVVEKAPCQVGESVAAIDSMLVEPASSITCGSKDAVDSQDCQRARRLRNGESHLGQVYGDGKVGLYVSLGMLGTITVPLVFVTFVDDDKPVSSP